MENGQVLWKCYCNKSGNATGKKLANIFLLCLFRPPSNSEVPVSTKFELSVVSSIS